MKTHCKHGHLRTPENLDKRGACKTCKGIWQRANADPLGQRAKTRYYSHPDDWRRYKALRRIWPVLRKIQPEVLTPAALV